MPESLCLLHDIRFVGAGAATRCGTVPNMALEQLPQVASPTLARNVSIICRRHKAHCFGGAREHVAQGVCKALKIVCTEANFVMDDVVVSRLRCALQTTMGYKKRFISEINNFKEQ